MAPTSQPVFDPLIGSRLGRYRIEARVGEGGMGTVYRAEQTPLGRTVALKVIHRALAADGKIVSRFLREAKIACQLTNPHTVTIFDFGSEGDQLYLAMELLAGESLQGRLARGPVAPERAAEIAAQTCRSLIEAHRKGIIHRDLKPDNIFLTSGDDGSLLVKVLDYGLARMMSSDEAPHPHATLTQIGTIVGTPVYMSPEQARGRKLDTRTDLYSMGVVLFEMLAGVAPFTDEDAVVVLGKHIRDPVPRLSAVGAKLAHPPALQTLVDKLLEKEPSKRPPDAAWVYQELRAYLSAVAGSTGPTLPNTVESTARTAASSDRAHGAASGVQPKIGDAPDAGPVVDTVEDPRAGALSGAAAVRPGSDEEMTAVPTTRMASTARARPQTLPLPAVAVPSGSVPAQPGGVSEGARQRAGLRSMWLVATPVIALCLGLVIAAVATHRSSEPAALPPDEPVPGPVPAPSPVSVAGEPAPTPAPPTRSEPARPTAPEPLALEAPPPEPATPPGLTPIEGGRFSGRWMSSRGPMELRQRGASVTGAFGGAGRLEGTVEGSELRAEWREGGENGRALLRSYENRNGQLRLLGSWGHDASAEGERWTASPRTRAAPTKRAGGLVVPNDRIFGSGGRSR